VGIAAAGHWDNATDEELEKAVRLTAIALNRFATFAPILLEYVKPLLSETWRRIVSGRTCGDEGRHQRLADILVAVAHSAAKGHPYSLLHIFTFGIDELDWATFAERFDALNKATSNAGKLLLLDILLYALGWNIAGVTKGSVEQLPRPSTGGSTRVVNVAAVLLGNPQLEQWRALEEVAARVREFVANLRGVERAYAVAYLYPRLALWYASSDKSDKAVEYAEESLKALDELLKAEENKTSMEEKLRPYLELKGVQNLERELYELSHYTYYHTALAYMVIDKLDKAVEYAKETCKKASELGKVYYENACSLLPRLEAVRDDILHNKELKKLHYREFEELWKRASRAFEQLGAEALATILGKYVVALASVAHPGNVERVLEEWGWALELHPDTLAFTYGVLSLFDEKHLDKTIRYLPVAKATLPKLADALYDAVEVGLFSEEPEIANLAIETLRIKYGKDIVIALDQIASTSRMLFLSVLVGLAYCMRGEEWGFKLARAAARAGLRFKDIYGRLFGELYKALESATVGNCITDEVLTVIYKLYYAHV